MSDLQCGTVRLTWWRALARTQAPHVSLPAAARIRIDSTQNLLSAMDSHGWGSGFHYKATLYLAVNRRLPFSKQQLFVCDAFHYNDQWASIQLLHPMLCRIPCVAVIPRDVYAAGLYSPWAEYKWPCWVNYCYIWRHCVSEGCLCLSLSMFLLLFGCKLVTIDGEIYHSVCRKWAEKGNQ